MVVTFKSKKDQDKQDDKRKKKNTVKYVRRQALSSYIEDKSQRPCEQAYNQQMDGVSKYDIFFHFIKISFQKARHSLKGFLPPFILGTYSLGLKDSYKQQITAGVFNEGFNNSTGLLVMRLTFKV